jgi:hypothetical protein
MAKAIVTVSIKDLSKLFAWKTRGILHLMGEFILSINVGGVVVKTGAKLMVVDHFDTRWSAFNVEKGKAFLTYDKDGQPHAEVKKYPIDAIGGWSAIETMSNSMFTFVETHKELINKLLDNNKNSSSEKRNTQERIADAPVSNVVTSEAVSLDAADSTAI